MRFALATSSARLVPLDTTIATHEFPDPGASPGIRPEVIIIIILEEDLCEVR
jgi:hypothetical protein